MDLDDVRHEHFAGRIGEPFEVSVDDGDGGVIDIELRLSAATVPAGDRPDHAHFVEWMGPLDRPLQQGIHRLRHEDLGDLELFLVPVNQESAGFVYEAVFTRVDD